VPYNNGFDLEWMREYTKTLFSKCNANLMKTFKGILQEKDIPANSTSRF